MCFPSAATYWSLTGQSISKCSLSSPLNFQSQRPFHDFLEWELFEDHKSLEVSLEPWGVLYFLDLFSNLHTFFWDDDQLRDLHFAWLLSRCLQCNLLSLSRSDSDAHLGGGVGTAPLASWGFCRYVLARHSIIRPRRHWSLMVSMWDLTYEATGLI